MCVQEEEKGCWGGWGGVQVILLDVDLVGRGCIGGFLFSGELRNTGCVWIVLL